MNCTRSFSRTPPGSPGGRSIVFAVALSRTVSAVLAGEPESPPPSLTPIADALAPDKSPFTLWKFSAFADSYNWTSTEHGVPWWGSVDVGLTNPLSKNVQLDLGVSVGVSFRF